MVHIAHRDWNACLNASYMANLSACTLSEDIKQETEEQLQYCFNMAHGVSFLDEEDKADFLQFMLGTLSALRVMLQYGEGYDALKHCRREMVEYLDHYHMELAVLREARLEESGATDERGSGHPAASAALYATTRQKRHIQHQQHVMAEMIAEMVVDIAQAYGLLAEDEWALGTSIHAIRQHILEALLLDAAAYELDFKYLALQERQILAYCQLVKHFGMHPGWWSVRDAVSDKMLCTLSPHRKHGLLCLDRDMETSQATRGVRAQQRLYADRSHRFHRKNETARMEDGGMAPPTSMRPLDPISLETARGSSFAEHYQHSLQVISDHQRHILDCLGKEDKHLMPRHLQR